MERNNDAVKLISQGLELLKSISMVSPKNSQKLDEAIRLLDQAVDKLVT